MRFFILLAFCCTASYSFSQRTDSLRQIVLLNSRPIHAKNLSFIHPGKIKSIEVNSDKPDTIAYYVTSKPIQLLTYKSLKSRLNLNSFINPELVVDNCKTDTADFLIDKSFIRKAKYKEGTIYVKSRTKRSKVPRPCAGVIRSPRIIYQNRP